jgi:Domain of unknown function (DUF929)
VRRLSAVVVAVLSMLGLTSAAHGAGSAARGAAPARPLPALVAARHDLGMLAGEARSPAVKRALLAAEAAVGRATAPTLWLDPGHLVAPSYGLSVFTDSRAALTALERVPSAALPSGALAGVEAEILSADRDLAVGSFLQARRGNGGLLSRARGMILSGDRWAGTSRIDLAAEQYGAGWQDAFQALTELVARQVASLSLATVGAAARDALRRTATVPVGVSHIGGRPELEASGKPQVLFVGIESCRFCAVERWGLVVALSQFGTFTNLDLGQSETTAPPVVRSFTFAGARYQSPYVSLAAVELSGEAPRPGGGFAPLGHLTAAQRRLFTALDPEGLTPFVDVANRFRDLGATEPPRVLAGPSWAALVGSVRRPESPAGQAIAATAEVLTAEICRATGGAPASVCGGAVVQDYANRLARFSRRGSGCAVGSGETVARRRRIVRGVARG